MEEEEQFKLAGSDADAMWPISIEASTWKSKRKNCSLLNKS